MIPKNVTFVNHIDPIMNHKWQYCSLGGVVRVKISTGEDIACLGELDEKYWTVLSCPVNGLAMDRETLSCLDADSDGKIRVKEVVAAAEWLCACIKDNDFLLKGDSSISLDAFDDSDPNGPGAKLKRSARQILDNLGKEGDVIGIGDVLDSTAIFKGTRFNGDGVVTPLTAGDDSVLKDTIADCIATVGSVPDRSGEQGVTAEMIGKFYDLCREYSQWRAAAVRDSVFPYGDKTPAAYAACCTLKEKMADFFMRCRLLGYDAAAAAALEVKIEKPEDLASCPIARPAASGVLSLNVVNPAWDEAVSNLVALVPESDLAGKDGITEQGWRSFCARFNAYEDWLASKKGEAVESLGLDRINAILDADRRQELLDLAAADSAKKEESGSMDEVRKFMYLYRDFGRFLRNYVIFSDFYDRPGRRAIFEAGRLFIDQRCCDLCIKVDNMAGQNDMAKLSGMFLIYCRCTSKVRSESLDIVAVLTAGDTGDLRPGKNGIFYDLQGRDWDATITKVVDNPISIANAFWAPYRKFWDFCVGLISKSAEEKDSKVMKEMQEKASRTLASPPDTSAAAKEQTGGRQAFDIAKFAGIFAAIGMAIGYIGSFLTKLAAGIAATPWWQLLVAIAAIMLVISGPSCFLAWTRLRQRNLGPVLNANGWAMNTKVLVNIVFGNILTSVAKYPKLKFADPYRPKKSAWKWIVPLLVFLLLVGAAAAVYFHCF